MVAFVNIPLDNQQAVSDITQIAKRVGWNYQSTIVWNEGNIQGGLRGVRGCRRLRLYCSG